MSYLQIRGSVLSELIAVINSASIGYTIGIANENDDFDPKNYDIWVAPTYVPTTSETLGKGYSSMDDERGFMQVSVYIKQNSLTLYNVQLELIDVIKSSFWNGYVIDDTTVAESTLNNGRPFNGWFVRDLTINLISFIKRG